MGEKVEEASGGVGRGGGGGPTAARAVVTVLAWSLPPVPASPLRFLTHTHTAPLYTPRAGASPRVRHGDGCAQQALATAQGVVEESAVLLREVGEGEGEECMRTRAKSCQGAHRCHY